VLEDDWIALAGLGDMEAHAVHVDEAMANAGDLGQVAGELGGEGLDGHGGAG
jgi:hypothetical protein